MSSRKSREDSRVSLYWFWIHMGHPGMKYVRARKSLFSREKSFIMAMASHQSFSRSRQQIELILREMKHAHVILVSKNAYDENKLLSFEIQAKNFREITSRSDKFRCTTSSPTQAYYFISHIKDLYESLQVPESSYPIYGRKLLRAETNWQLPTYSRLHVENMIFAPGKTSWAELPLARSRDLDNARDSYFRNRTLHTESMRGNSIGPK